MIRVIRSDDAAALLPLLAQVQDLHVQAHPEMFREDAPDEERAQFLGNFLSRDGVTALAKYNEAGRITGYALYELMSRSESALNSARRIGFLHQIVVDEACRRQGIARALIEEMKARLRDAGITRLGSEHFSFNEASAELMKSAGMVPLRVTVEGKI